MLAGSDPDGSVASGPRATNRNINLLKFSACRLALLTILAAVGCKPDARNISYVAGGTDSLNALDIYGPRWGRRHPVVIFIHGGSYTEGDKLSEAGAKPKTFTAAGYVFVSVNYRLSPAVQHPTHIQDVAKAIAWVRANIQRYHGDSTRLFVLGHSSGASLAALIATNERFLQAEGMDLSSLSGAILLDGSAYDIPRRFAEDTNDARRLRPIIGSDPEAWKDASALYHCEPNKGIPPFLIVHLTTRPSSSAQALALGSALEAAGTRVIMKPVSTVSHYRLNLDLGLDKDPVTADVFAFIGSAETGAK
jgi:acetyl esterase/lipase